MGNGCRKKENDFLGFTRKILVESHLRQLNKNKVAESLDFTGVMPLFMFKRMLYGNTTLKFF